MSLRTIPAAVAVLLCVSCASGPPKPVIPELTPGVAAQLLSQDSRAQTWLEHIKKENSTCEYVVPLPEQTPRIAQIDVAHVVLCAGSAAPRELDASVTFEYDPETQRWTLKRFSS